jgi:microcystin-dependent protein
MAFFDDNKRLSSKKSAPAAQAEKRIADAGPNVPLVTEDPEEVSSGAQWVNEIDLQIKVLIGDVTYFAQLVPEGENFFPTPVAFPVGSSIEFAGSALPTDEANAGKWLFENGALLDRNLYPDLFAVIGTAFNSGGETSAQFRLPDSRGRTIVGAGQGAGLTNRTLSAFLGGEEAELFVGNMPSHDHGGTTSGDGGHSHSISSSNGVVRNLNHNFFTMRGVVGDHEWTFVEGATWTSTDLNNTNSVGNHSHNLNVSSTGSGIPHNNMQPSLVKNRLIRVLL